MKIKFKNMRGENIMSYENENNRERSFKIIENWIKSNTKVGYKSLEESEHQGFMYTLTVDGITFNSIIRILDEGLTFETSLDVMVNKQFRSVVARYCQKIEPRFGYVFLDNISGNIVFHNESFLVDGAISEEILDVFEDMAITVLSAHYDNFKRLASGRMVVVRVEEDFEKENNRKNKEFDKADCISSIKDYLLNGITHNMICEEIEKEDEENKDLYCQILTGNESYRALFSVDPAGILTVEGTYGETPYIFREEGTRYLAARVFNEDNSEKKYGAIFVGSKQKGVHCRVQTSVVNGISPKTLTFMECIIFRSLHDGMEKLLKIENGELGEQNEEEINTLKIFKYLTETEEGKKMLHIINEMKLKEKIKKVKEDIKEKMALEESLTNMNMNMKMNEEIDEEMSEEEIDEDEISMTDFMVDIANITEEDTKTETMDDIEGDAEDGNNKD